MRRFTTAITAAALGLSVALSLGGGSAKALTPGYDSAYQFESAFLSLKAGDSGTFSVFFANTGTTSWVTGAGTQVNLAVCADNKVTCNVASANAAWASGWLSATAYATHTKSVVAPGDFSAFTYNIKAPTAATAGTYRFNGDLVVASSGDRIHPEGYFQDASVSGVAPPPGGGALSISEDYPANVDNEVSTTVPGTGQHTFTVTTTLTGTLTFMIIASGNVSRASNGTFSFCDTNTDKRADTTDNNSNAVFFTAVNGASISQSNVIINQPIPSSGTMSVALDSATRNQRVRVIAWQDKNNNGQIDLTAAGDVNCDFIEQSPYDLATDGVLASSARKWFFGPQGQFGSQFGVTSCAATTTAEENAKPRVFRHDTANQVIGSGLAEADNSRGQKQSLRFFYDSNDIFKVRGTQVTLATFKAELTASTTGGADTIVIAYDPNPAGTSTFEVCRNRGADAPDTITAAGGNFDNGSTAEDVRITFTSPSVNTILTFSIQRVQFIDANGVAINGGLCTAGASTNPNGSITAPPHDGTLGTPQNSTWTTVGATSTPGVAEQATFTSFDLANGSWCFRVLVNNPNTGVNSYSAYSTVVIPATGDTVRPLSSQAGLTTSSGFADTLDNGDKLWFDFTDAGCTNSCISIAANATIRVTDSDCGNATNTGPATCSGGQTNTVADIICGTNASCTLETVSGRGTNNQLIVTMTGNPTVISAGSTAGPQFPLVVTDSNGITDLSGNAWDIENAGGDRLIGPGVGP